MTQQDPPLKEETRQLIRNIKQADQAQSTIFRLPTGFDAKKFASRFVEEGHAVEAAKQDEIIAGAGLAADGWEVYLHEKKPHIVVSGSTKYVLMHRLQDVQKAVNTAYANYAKDMRTHQTERKATAGGRLDPSQIATDADLTALGIPA